MVSCAGTLKDLLLLGQRALTPPPIFSGLLLPCLFVFLLLLSFRFSFFLFKNYKIHQNLRKVQKIVLLIFHHFPPRISRMRDWEPYSQQQTHQAHLAFRSTALSLACFASSPHPKPTSWQSLAPDIPLPGGHTELGPLNDYVHSHSMEYFYTNCSPPSHEHLWTGGWIMIRRTSVGAHRQAVLGRPRGYLF